MKLFTKAIKLSIYDTSLLIIIVELKNKLYLCKDT
jgi:hypothetical protein